MLWGSMLGMSDPSNVLNLMDRIEALGIDVMSFGVVLAWTTEALEQAPGLLSSRRGLKINRQ